MPKIKSVDWRGKNSYYHDIIEKYLTFYTSKSDSLLILGCGNGKIFDGVASSSFVGIDVHQEFIHQGLDVVNQMQKGKLYHVKDYASLPDLNQTFDSVILYNVIPECTDIQAVLQGLRPLVTSRSRLIMNFHSHLWSPILHIAEKLGLKRPTGETTWVTIEDIQNFLGLTGWELITQEKRILFPKKVFGLGSFINRWIAPLPMVDHLCLENIVLARPMDLKTRRDIPSVTVVIPARNEAGNIENAIKQLPPMDKHTEVIFVEGHSNDKTWEEILRVKGLYPEKDIKAMKQQGKGKADAVQLGFLEARGDLLMILDADLTVAPKDLTKFYHAIVENKGEFINGCRLVYPMEKQAMRFLNMIANKLFGWLFTWLLGQRYRDTLCGTKVLWKTDYMRLVTNRRFFGNFDPFGDFDLILGATKLGLKSIEVPIRYKERTYGETNISRFRHGILLFQMFFLAAKRLKFRRL